jgi:L-seryl-tRNA(Ser) seleniumtransferase
VPILVDAAGQVYLVERMRSFPAAGADLIAYAAKYFGAPNASGFLAGKRELVEAAVAQGFIAFEHGFHAAIGRPLKLDRQVIIAIVVALQEWLATDHEARLRNNDRKAQTIARAIRGLAGVTVTQRPDPPARATSLQVCIDRTKVGKNRGRTWAHSGVGLPCCLGRYARAIRSIHGRVAPHQLRVHFR